MTKPKSVKALIIGAFGKEKKALSLSEIYKEVKRYRPETEDATVRGRINESILNDEKVFRRLGGGVYDIVNQ